VGKLVILPGTADHSE